MDTRHDRAKLFRGRADSDCDCDADYRSFCYPNRDGDRNRRCD
jgi:hypothetical protein